MIRHVGLSGSSLRQAALLRRRSCHGSNLWHRRSGTAGQLTLCLVANTVGLCVVAVGLAVDLSDPVMLFPGGISCSLLGLHHGILDLSGLNFVLLFELL